MIHCFRLSNQTLFVYLSTRHNKFQKPETGFLSPMHLRFYSRSYYISISRKIRIFELSGCLFVYQQNTSNIRDLSSPTWGIRVTARQVVPFILLGLTENNIILTPSKDHLFNVFLLYLKRHTPLGHPFKEHVRI